MEPERYGTTPEEHDTLRVQELAVPDEQRLLRVIAQRAVLFWALDVLSVMRLAWDTLALRGVWAGLMLALAWKLPSLPPRYLVFTRFFVTVLVPTVSCALITHRLGGTSNPMFSTFALLPVLALVLPWRHRWDGVLRAGLPLAGALAVMVMEGTPASRMVTWLVVLVGAALMGVNMSRYHQRLVRAWLQVREEQRETRRQVEESRERALRAERLAQVGRLAAGVAHEVRNPLAYVQANLRYLLEESGQPTHGADASEYAEALRETMQGVERIHQIVKDLTVLSRAEDTPTPAVPCQLAPIIDSSVRLASVRLKSLVKLSVEVADTPLAIAEPRRLGQVLLNLLLNAADAIEDGKVHDGQVAVRVEWTGTCVRVLVEDNGPGIAAEHLCKLFTTFFTTKAPDKGTGLGLALSRQYVESFGGSLRAENRAEGGARFVVELKPG
jgi:two-component system, sensor histidine kinase PhcS